MEDDKITYGALTQEREDTYVRHASRLRAYTSVIH